MFNRYRLIKIGQIKKKFGLYRLAFGVLFDLTTTAYVLGLLGYIAFAIISGADFSFTALNLEKIEAFTARNIWNIAIILPLFHLFRAFSNPGIIFSTTEYTLTHLPVTKRSIWLMRAIERWIIVLVQFILVGIALAIISETDLQTLLFYVGIIVFVNLLMTAITWKVFQLHLWKQTGILLGYSAIVLALLMINSPYTSIGMLLLLVLLNIIIYPRLFKQVNWKKVTAAGDFRLWNMPLISNVSQVKMKKAGKNSQLRVLRSWTRPFNYEKHSVYHRLWVLYFEKNIVILLQLFGGLSVILVLLIFLKKGLFLPLLAISILAISSVAAAMFRERLESDVVEVLPWDVFTYKRTLMMWVLIFSSILVIPFLIYVIIHKIYLFPIQLFIFWVALYFSVNGRLATYIFAIDNRYVSNELFSTGAWVLILVLMFANVLPVLLIPGSVIAVLMLINQGKVNSMGKQ